MNCSEIQEKLDAHVMGALDKNTSKIIEEHVKTCAACQACLAETVKAMDFLHALPGIEPQGGYADKILSLSHSKRRIFSSLTIVLFLFFIVVLVLIWTLTQYKERQPYHHLWSVERGIWNYRTSKGVFPSQSGKSLGTALLTEQGGPYLSPKAFKTSPSGEILDIWGTPYIYRYPGTHLVFDLYSCGRNKVDENGEGDDIANWHIGKK